MQLQDAIFNRRSVRQYAEEEIDEPTIRRLISAAVQAPNAVNEQPWRFIVVRDREVLDRISREAKAHMLATMPTQHEERFRDRLSDPAFDIFYHAPALVVISGRAQEVVDRRGLRDGRAESDARRLRRRARNVLDRLRPGLSRHASGKGRPRRARGVAAGRADHRRPACRLTAAGCATGTRNPLDRLIQQRDPGGRRRRT